MGGGILTGIFAYPYGHHWDNFHIYREIQLGNYPSLWMGWFYPYLWSGLIKITGLQFAIGLFQNILYWGSLPVIHRYFFNKLPNKLYIFSYIVLAANFPLMVLMMHNLNSTLVLSFLMAGLALHCLYLEFHRPFIFLLMLGCFLCAYLTRRDAFTLIIPFLGYIFFQHIKGHYTGRVFKALFLCMLFMASERSLTYLVVKDYSKSYYVNWGGLPSSLHFIPYDLYMISYYKKTVALPHQYLPEPREENSEKIMATLESVAGEFNDIVLRSALAEKGINYNIFGLPLNEAIPIYSENIPHYLLYRFKFFCKYSTASKPWEWSWPITYPAIDETLIKHNKEYTLSRFSKFRDKLRLRGISIIIEKLPVLFTPLVYFILFAGSLYYLIRKKRLLFDTDTVFTLLALAISCLFSISLFFMTVSSISARYLSPYLWIMWFTFVYTVFYGFFKPASSRI